MKHTLVALSLMSAVLLASVRTHAQTGAPSSLDAVVTGTSVTLTWQAPVGNVLTYVIEVGSGSGLSDLVNAPTGSTSTALSVGNVPFGTYFVRLRAYSSATGLSGVSNEVVVVVAPCALAAPANMTAVVMRNSVSLAWSPVARAETYQLEAGSTPTLTDLVSADVGRTSALQVSAPSGIYYVRVRAKAGSCATSAPSPDTVVRVGVAAGIGFGGVVGTHGEPFTSYSESGFTVEAMTAAWTINRGYGAPLPSIQFVRTSDATETGRVRVTAGGDPFRFTSVDLYSSVTPIPYSITGLLNSTTVFAMTGTVPNTFGALATVSASTSHLAVDTLIISVDNPATPSCPTCAGNPVGIDNIAVSF